MSAPCFLYVIEAPDYTLAKHMQCFKVGITNSVGSRLSTFQTGSPFRLRLARSIKLPNRKVARLFERRMHETLDTSCITGEWFCTYLIGALIELESVAAHYWLECGGEIQDMAAWFEQIGLEAKGAELTIASEGLE